ncbi:MAG TPA: hypothetical protein VN905_05975 [Candidatus Binatia bacterium]|nr:hypothetical protein [Candidatus Binatia bacterium]
MRCSSSRRLFESFLDASLSAREEGEFVQHLERCIECRTVFAQFRAVDALLLQPGPVELIPNFTQRAMAEVRAMPAPRPVRILWLAYIAAYLAASWLAIGLALIFAGPETRAMLAAVLGTSGAEMAAVGAFAGAVERGLGRSLSTLTIVSAGALLLDIAFVAILIVARRARSESVR